MDEQMKQDLYEFYKEAATSPEELKKKRLHEVELLAAFKKNRNPDTFTALYQSYKPFVIRAASRNMQRSFLPESAHMAFAANSFLSAVDNFDPSKGALGTHIYDTVFQKGKRLNYKYQNIGYIPEDRTSKYGQYLRAVGHLQEELGREPSTIEIADEMRWPVSKVELLRQEDKKDLILNETQSGLSPTNRSNKVNQMLHDISYELIPEHALVLEHATGLNGRTALLKPNGGPDIPALKKATKLPEQKIRNAFRTISRKYREHRGEMIATDADDVSGIEE